ncbi:winged helix DNA-binding domain-containing protein [Spirillospora sp. CA-255316]
MKDSTADRGRVLAYRYAAHDLAPGGGRGDTVLATGLQDYPPGRTAVPALRLRTGTAEPGASAVLVHSIRGAMHLHRAADLAPLAAALRIEDGRDLPPQAIGPFGTVLAGAGITFGAALDEVAAAMREAVAGGGTPTKGELSGTVSPRVDRPLAPWCKGCGVHHVQDMLFRMATLQAGLLIEVDDGIPSRFRLRAAAEPFEPGDPADARAGLVRAFLATSGPSHPAQLASWLACTPAAARRWWDLVADELVPVTVDGGKYWTHADHQEALKAAPAPAGVRLLPPYDPVTELADRKLLVPDDAHRKQVWRTAANPGVLLVDGEIAGVWRQRRARGRLSLRIEPFTELSAGRRRAAEADAAVIADHAGASGADLSFV